MVDGCAPFAPVPFLDEVQRNYRRQILPEQVRACDSIATAKSGYIKIPVNRIRNILVRKRSALGLFAGLLIAGQIYAVVHAGEFGPAPHEHNGVVCIAVSTDEQEGLVPTANLTASKFTALTSATLRSARQAPQERPRSVRPPPTGPPSI